MKPRILIIGAGGHARVVVSIVEHIADWEAGGVLDRVLPNLPEKIGGFSIEGTYNDAARLYASGVKHAALAVGDNYERADLHVQMTAVGFHFPALRHPSSIVENNVHIGDGSVVCAGAILCTGVRVGRGVIINTGAIIDHETIIGDHCHIAPGCCVAGRVHIGDHTMVGIGSCVREKIRIGAGSIIGAGSTVVEDIPENVVAYGNPARVARVRAV